MKNRTLLFVGISAIITLSFSFISVNERKAEVEAKVVVSRNISNEPLGGFTSEDRI
jgi:hypothetical protein